MQLIEVYKDIRTLEYPIDYFKKQAFGRAGVKFCKLACKASGIKPIKKYPYHNKGGDGVWGEIYCKVQHPTSDRVLEICLSEMGPYVRTNGKDGYGPNIWFCGGMSNYERMELITETNLSIYILEFLQNIFK